MRCIPVPSQRLRDLEVHRACPEGGVVVQSLRIRHMGGEIRSEFEPQPGDIVALEHWCSSGFANTDLDLQLKKHGIHKLVVIGLIAHTCVEATVRFAAELGYEVTIGHHGKGRNRITRMKRCTPLSTSISQTTPLPW